VAEFLGETWFEALAAALAALPVTTAAAETGAARPAGPVGTAVAEPGLAIGQIVTGIPGNAGADGVRDGEVRWTIVLSPYGAASLVRNSTEEADVTLVEDWSTAEAIASGSSSVPEMLSAGKIKVHGNTRALVLAGDFLAGIAPLVAAGLGRAGAAS